MDLATYREFQKQLLELLGKAAEIARELGFTALIRSAGELERRVLSERFSVAVLGEIKRGKSTLINALLGEDVLPRAALVCTAALCLIRYADAPIAIAHDRDGAAKEVDPSTLKEWVTRRNPSAHLVDHVEIGWPLPLLRDGVVIIDTPGVNDTDEVRRRLTEEFIPRADGVIFVLNAGQPLSDSEVRFLKNGVLKHHIRKCWFVVNGIDRIPDEAQRKEAVEYCRRNLAEIHPDIRLWGVSAKAALEARRNGDNEAWSRSGVADLLNGLSVDLVESRRDALCEIPLARFESMLDDLEKGHAMLTAALDRSRHEAEQATDEREREIETLETDRERILTRFANGVESLIFETARAAEADRPLSPPSGRRAAAARGAVPPSAEHRTLRAAVEAVLSSDSLDEAKIAGLHQLVRDQILIEAENIFDRISRAIRPLAADCSRELSQQLARFDSRISLGRPCAAAPLVEFRKDFEIESVSLGLEARQFVSGFGRLAAVAFLLQGNLLFAAASLGASLAARLTGDMTREVTANLEHLIAEGKKKLRHEIVRRRAEISQTWKRDLSVRFDQGFSVIREAVAASRNSSSDECNIKRLEIIPCEISSLRLGLETLKTGRTA
ncbi:MAG: Bacterial dynamin-like protein [bacterium ADurb.Bin374]|nr:MAG: Bacterial dynamin-like protein [bacterium ADurb.Bin374]